MDQSVLFRFGQWPTLLLSTIVVAGVVTYVKDNDSTTLQTQDPHPQKPPIHVNPPGALSLIPRIESDPESPKEHAHVQDLTLSIPFDEPELPDRAPRSTQKKHSTTPKMSLNL